MTVADNQDLDALVERGLATCNPLDMRVAINALRQEVKRWHEIYADACVSLVPIVPAFGGIPKAAQKIAEEIRTLRARVAELEQELSGVTCQRDNAWAEVKRQTDYKEHPGRTRPSGCACHIDDDDNIIQWCGLHGEIRDRATIAESQLRQVKADAERTREENELLRLRVIDLQEQLQTPPRTETGATLCQHRIAHSWMNSDGSSGFKCDECGLQYTAVSERRNDGTA